MCHYLWPAVSCNNPFHTKLPFVLTCEGKVSPEDASHSTTVLQVTRNTMINVTVNQNTLNGSFMVKNMPTE